MKPESHSWLIITSDDNAVVADALNSMIVLPEDITAQVFSIKKNRAYDNIDNNQLARVEYTYVSTSFKDTKALEAEKFNKKYKKNNYTSPSQYSIKGFDVTYDVLMRLASGKKLSDTFKEGASLRLEAKFNYDASSTNAIENKGLFIVKYNKDLSLMRLK